MFIHGIPYSTQASNWWFHKSSIRGSEIDASYAVNAHYAFCKIFLISIFLDPLFRGRGIRKTGQCYFLKDLQKCHLVQVNLCQKLLFLHQLTHNMTTDFSLNYSYNCNLSSQNMLCTKIVFCIFSDI